MSNEEETFSAKTFPVKFCPTCDYKMNHFENPDRYICPREGKHAQIGVTRKG